jgi:hypothetical protein
MKSYVDSITRLTEEKSELEAELQNSQKENEDLRAEKAAEVEKMTDQFKNVKIGLDHEIQQLKAKIESIEQFRLKEEEITQSLKDTKQALELEKKERHQQVNAMEREKIQATEKLRKDMLFKIKETKATLLSLNDEQLNTTTRLTILQNHQLTTELEY